MDYRNVAPRFPGKERSMIGESGRKLAVLIDAENISHKYVKILLDEASNYGSVVYKRIYGDWSNASVSSWRNVILDYSIHPIQQFSNTKGKNATDSAMIIDAMDLLHTGKLQGFCIVSSDSDFTRLAGRLRESEMLVIGMGERKTPASFISACDRFCYLDVLLDEKRKDEAEAAKLRAVKSELAEASKDLRKETQAEPEVKTGRDLDEIVKAIGELIDEHSDDEGWVFLGSLGHGLQSRYPDFDARNFGYRKLSEFVRSLRMFETHTQNNVTYIRRKQAKSKKAPAAKAAT